MGIGVSANELCVPRVLAFRAPRTGQEVLRGTTQIEHSAVVVHELEDDVVSGESIGSVVPHARSRVPLAWECICWLLEPILPDLAEHRSWESGGRRTWSHWRFVSPKIATLAPIRKPPKAILTCVEDNPNSRHGLLVRGSHNDAV